MTSRSGGREQQAQKTSGREAAGNGSIEGCFLASVPPCGEKVVKPAGRKQLATHMINQYQFSERRASQLSGVSRTAYRYQAKPASDDALRQRLIELATQHKGLGCPMLHGMLKTEGLVINFKHTYRLYCEERLKLRNRKKKN